MNAKLTVDSKSFNKAMQDYVRVSSRKTIPRILNDKTPIVIKKAMWNTPKVSRAKISSDLGTQTAPSILAMKIIYARAKRSGKKITRQEAKKRASAMIRARMGAVRYVSLGWLKSLARWRSVNKPLKSSSRAAKGGYGVRANGSRHQTVFVNAAPGNKHGESALEKALDQEASSMRKYTASKLGLLAKKYKG
jgi:hypothetical protein